MPEIYFVTYATHEQGLFKKLINNEHGVQIEVLGMGTKWTGFFDKVDGIMKFARDKQPDDIIVFLDGFDTIVNTKPDDLMKHFRSYGAKILVSLDHGTEDVYAIVDWTQRHVFGNCNGVIANSGLYMGEVSELKKMWRNMKRQYTADDQRALNSVCSIVDIAIDTERLIFENKTLRRTPRKHEPIFVSFPGGGDPDITWYDLAHRYLWRAPFEYVWLLPMEIIVAILILLVGGLYLYFNYKF
jgi:hypothetical protein